MAKQTIQDRVSELDRLFVTHLIKLVEGQQTAELSVAEMKEIRQYLGEYRAELFQHEQRQVLIGAVNQHLFNKAAVMPPPGPTKQITNE